MVQWLGFNSDLWELQIYFGSRNHHYFDFDSPKGSGVIFLRCSQMDQMLHSSHWILWHGNVRGMSYWKPEAFVLSLTQTLTSAVHTLITEWTNGGENGVIRQTETQWSVIIWPSFTQSEGHTWQLYRKWKCLNCCCLWPWYMKPQASSQPIVAYCTKHPLIGGLPNVDTSLFHRFPVPYLRYGLWHLRLTRRTSWT